MAVRIQLRRGTAAQWTAANPTLAAGEVGVETDTLQFKVGNGATAWSALEYKAGEVSQAQLETAVALADTNPPPLARAVNLSGSFHVAANWYKQGTDAAVVTALTPAQFLAEQPDAVIPRGHRADYGILKIEVTGNSTPRIRGANLPGPYPFADLKNVTMRWYMPPAMADRFATVTAGNTVQLFLSADDTVGTLTNYYTRTNNYRPTLNSVALRPGNHHTTMVSAMFASGAGTLGRYLSYLLSAAGDPGAGSMKWVSIGVQGDELATPASPLVLYLLDMVELRDAAEPTLYMRWDDALTEHRQVSAHLRAGTRFGGGSLAAPLPSTFAIIGGLVDTAGYLATQELRDMVAEGSTLATHGVSGSWSTKSDAEIEADIEPFFAMVDAEGWSPAFKKAIAFPGNDNHKKSLDGTLLSDLLKSLGLTFNTGHAAFGWGFSLGAPGDPMNTAALITLGQTTGTHITSAADMETVIAFMARTGLSLILMGHGVRATPGSIDITETVFDAIMGVIADEMVAAAPRVRVADLIGDARRARLVS
jgi:hypothetical protein